MLHTVGQLVLDRDLKQLSKSAADTGAEHAADWAERDRPGDAHSGLDEGDGTFHCCCLGVVFITGGAVRNGRDESAARHVFLHELGHPALFAEALF